MIRAFLGALVLLAAMLPARAEEPGETIRAVIADQIRAFETNDLAAAYAHASPSIQRKFPSPEIFGRMVRTGYPMIWRPARYRMLGLAQTPRGPVQKVLVEDRDGRLYEAAYEMREVDGAWRINGVYLRPLDGTGV